MKITKKQLKRIIKEEKRRLLSEMTPAAPGRGAQEDQNLKDYQDGWYVDNYNDAEDRLTEALYLMIDMFVEMNGVKDAEAKQMTMEFIRDTLGVQ